MADVDITSLSVEISAESSGAELNIDKLATAISNLRAKSNVSKVIDSLDKLCNSISALGSVQSNFDGLEKVTQFAERISAMNISANAKSINTLAGSLQKMSNSISGIGNFSSASNTLTDIVDAFNSLSSVQEPKGLKSTINSIKRIPDAFNGLQNIGSNLGSVRTVLNGFNSLPAVTAPAGLSDFLSLLRRIPKVIVEANKADYQQLEKNIQRLADSFSPLSALDFNNLKNLGSVLNQLNKIPDLTKKLDSKTLDDFSTACQKITDALIPLVSQLNNVNNAFLSLPASLARIIIQTNRIVTVNQNARNGYLNLSDQINGLIRGIARLVSLKSIANYIGQAVVKFNDYYEAANLFGVSMKNLTSESSDFISKMETLLGIDPTEAMNNMATIQSLTTSFGMASDKAYVLSKNLTQLGYDLASLKNIPVAESFTKIQAAISGELEPIRRLGVDLSQARLQQELLALGFTQSVSSLSQADKAVLRYIAIMKQTTDAQGDFARTISSPANQIRVLQAQLESLARSVGSLLYPALSSILPPLIAAVELVKELVQWIAKLMGVKVEFPDFSGAASNVGDVSDALDDTTDSTKKAAKALKDYTMGFDELNIIDPTQGSSGSDSGSGATGNILGDVDLSGYDMFKEYVGSSVDEIRAKLEKLAPLISGIAAGFATWAIASSFMEALKKVTGETKLIEGLIKLWKSPIMGAALAVAIMVARFVDLYQNCESFRLGLVRVKELIDLAVQGFQEGFNKSLTDGKLGESIEELKESLSGLKDSFLNALPEEIRDKIKKLDLDIGDLIVTLAGIGLCISGHPVAGLAVLGFEAITVAIRGLGDESASEMADMASDWKSKFEQIGAVAADVIADLIKGLADLIADISTFIRWVSEGPTEAERLDVSMNQGFIANALLGLADLIADVKTFIDWVVSLGEKISNAGSAFSQFLDDVQNWASEAGKAAANMVNAVADAIASLPSKMAEAGRNIWQGLVNGIKSGISNATGAAANLAKALIDKFTTDTEIHSPSALFARFGEFIDQGLANGIIGGLGYVENATNQLIGATAQAGTDFVNKGIDYGTGFVNNIITGLDNNWEQLNSSLQNDFLGTVQTFIQAAQGGDWKTVGTTIAATIWGAMGEEQRKQIKTVAADLVSQLGTALKNAASSLFDTAAKLGKNIVSGISNNFGEAVSKAQSMVGNITSVFKDSKTPLSSAALAISQGLKGGLLSQFPKMLSGVAGLITTIGASFTAMLESIGGVLSALGIPTGFAMVAGGLAIAATIAGIVASIGGSTGGSSDYTNSSNYVGSSSYDSGSYSSYDGNYYSGSSGNSEDTRDAVYNGCYNAFLDIMQRYGEQLLQGQEVKVYLDGKQLTASVEKTQKDRGISIMGTEVYSY